MMTRSTRHILAVAALLMLGGGASPLRVYAAAPELGYEARRNAAVRDSLGDIEADIEAQNGYTLTVRDSLHNTNRLLYFNSDPDTTAGPETRTIAAATKDTLDCVRLVASVDTLGIGKSLHILMLSGTATFSVEKDSLLGTADIVDDALLLDATGVTGPARWDFDERWIARVWALTGAGGGTWCWYIGGLVNRFMP